MARVIVKFRDVVRKSIPLQKETTTIGRTPTNDIAIENLAVSRHHAEIIQQGKGFFLRDLTSSNGTFVNGVRVVEQPLRDGDTILIGKHILTFVENDELAAAIAAAPRNSQDPDTFLRSTMEWEIPAEEVDAETTLQIPLPRQVDTPAALVVRAGTLAQERYLLRGEATIIGAAPYADIRLVAPNAPAVAAVIRYLGNHYEISPSETGLLLNKRKLIQQQPLENGHLITIQGVVFEFLAAEVD
ncbi:MAG: FHA domain-containing protein [Magnetococcales bacterium]|nr:FHA domain-containing protein [Magnetococcales bacterium]